MTAKKYALGWRVMLMSIIAALLLTACPSSAPAPAEGGDTAAAPAEAAPAADAPDIKEVAREKTLVVMAGGPNQYAQFDNQNPFIPGSDQAFHTGTLPAMYEPLIMFNVLTGEYENWLAESWEYNDD